jgi:dGTPase
MYRHPRVLTAMQNAQQALRALFGYYFEHTEELPSEWGSGLADANDFAKARRIADFIAGMTDNFALQEHGRFFDSRPDLR